MESEEDRDAMHFGAFKDNKLAAVVSVFQKDDDFQFRKLAVDTSMQQMGIGSGLLDYIIDHAAANGGKRIWCSARCAAIGFYLKKGFNQTGEAFSKSSIEYEIIEKVLHPHEKRA
ncbi:MAG: GNAT family N-acetyltransferase [Bacteroidota bacterium]|nr:GNAT family N-acetyltransferase [Bacteroidota bacterium]